MPAASVARHDAPASSDAHTADARAWSALADSLCRETGGLEYGGAVAEVENVPAISRVKSDDVSFGLARAAFFDVGDAKLRPEARPWLDRVIATFRDLSPARSSSSPARSRTTSRPSPPQRAPTSPRVEAPSSTPPYVHPAWPPRAS